MDQVCIQDVLIAPECLERMLDVSADDKTMLTVCRREFIYESVSEKIRGATSSTVNETPFTQNIGQARKSGMNTENLLGNSLLNGYSRT